MTYLAGTHASVTARIEQLMGVSADFLQRIVYMAEGDVFRFLADPPGQAIDLQLRQVLGLTQMDEFVQATRLADKAIKSRIDTAQELQQHISRLAVGPGSQIQQQMCSSDARRDRLLVDLGDIQQQITTHQRESQDLLRLVPLLDRAVPALRQDSTLWDRAQQMSILSLFSHLEQKVEEATALVQQGREQMARLDGERSAYLRVMEILLPYQERTDTLPCPVCGKPMTRAERLHIMQQLQRNVERIAAHAEALDRDRAQLHQQRDQAKRQADGLRELRNAVAHTSIPALGANAKVGDIERLIGVQKETYASRLKSLEDRATASKRQIAQVESEKAEYLMLQRRLEEAGVTSPEEVSDVLVGLEIRSLSLRAAGNAAQQTLAKQRDTDMRDIYDQIGRVWASFLGHDQWHVQLDSRGTPILEDSAGRSFDLSQFSGGEKTALLVILHTVIAHHFARCDFMLIDEPLEHLDPINRRSLVRFLVNAYRGGAFQQAIVATFEESLIRKYMAAEGINGVHL